MDRVTSLTYGDLYAPPKDNCFQKFVRHEHELQSATQAFRAFTIPNDDQLILRGCYKQLKLDVAPPKPCVEWTYHNLEDFHEKSSNGNLATSAELLGRARATR